MDLKLPKDDDRLDRKASNDDSPIFTEQMDESVINDSSDDNKENIFDSQVFVGRKGSASSTDSKCGSSCGCLHLDPASPYGAKLAAFTLDRPSTPMLSYSGSSSEESLPIDGDSDSEKEDEGGSVKKQHAMEHIETMSTPKVTKAASVISSPQIESPSLDSLSLILQPTGGILDDTMRGHDPNGMIPIPVVGNRALLFNVDHIKHLRVHHGIIGMLSGSLPLAPQQNSLLGLPLALSIYEVLYMLCNGIGYLVDGSKVAKAFLEDLTCDEGKLDGMVALFADDVARQRLERQRQYEDRMRKLGLADKISLKKDKFFFVKTRDNNFHFSPVVPHLDAYRENSDVQKLLLSKLLRRSTNEGLNTIYDDFLIFNYLKLNFRHTLMPGVRFGGKFVSYPGDPLRYHSHLIVDTRDYYNEDIGMLDISNRGRLATGVKKLWLVCGQKKKAAPESERRLNELAHPEESSGYNLVSELFDCKGKKLEETETVCFSIEWAGFG